MQFVFFNDFTPGLLMGRMVLDISPVLKGAGNVSPQGIVEYFITHYEELKPKLLDYCDNHQATTLKAVRLRAPVPRPCQLLCAIRNYIEKSDDTEKPPADMFLKAGSCVIGPGDTIELPEVQVRVFHHEAELAVVIKREAKKVPASKAMDYVFGITGFIDVSARGIGDSFFMKKSFDTFGPMGPTLVPLEDVPDPHKLQVKLWVNGELRQDYNTKDMANRIERLVEMASSVSTLMPGDVIATGTHHIGMGPLQDGETVKLETELVGSMTLKVVDPLHRVWEKKLTQ